MWGVAGKKKAQCSVTHGSLRWRGESDEYAVGAPMPGSLSWMSRMLRRREELFVAMRRSGGWAQAGTGGVERQASGV